MSLAKKLKHEVKSNPAKAGGLGLLLLVAVYFWAPLVAGFFAGEQPPPPPVAGSPAQGAVTPTVAAVPVAGASAPAASEGNTYNWLKNAAAMDRDPRMLCSIELPNDRDPFKSVATANRPTLTETAVDLTVTPEQAGLVLTSTWIGTRKKVAEIGGKSYRAGDVVRAARDSADWSFQVVEVLPRRVILKRNDKVFELAIPRPLLDGAERAADEPKASDKSDSSSDPIEVTTGELTE